MATDAGSPSEPVGEPMDMDMDSKEMRDTLLGVLVAGNLNKLTAASTRKLVEEELECKLDSPKQKRKLRLLIKQVLRNNESKFSAYKKAPAKSVKKKPTPRRSTASLSPSPSPTRGRRVRAAKKEATTPKKKTKRAPSTKVYSTSQKLRNIIDLETGMRKDISTKLWAYIKEKELQNPKNKKEIICNEVLEDLFGEKKVSILSVTKYVTQNITEIAAGERKKTPTPSDSGEGEKSENPSPKDVEEDKTPRRRRTSVAKPIPIPTLDDEDEEMDQDEDMDKKKGAVTKRKRNIDEDEDEDEEMDQDEDTDKKKGAVTKGTESIDEDTSKNDKEEAVKEDEEEEDEDEEEEEEEEEDFVQKKRPTRTRKTRK